MRKVETVALHALHCNVGQERSMREETHTRFPLIAFVGIVALTSLDAEKAELLKGPTVTSTFRGSPDA
jgi:hypothetical protein